MISRKQLMYKVTPKKIWDRRRSIITKTKELQFLAEDLFDVSMACIGISFKFLPVTVGGQFRAEMYRHGNKRYLETSSDISYPVESCIFEELFQDTISSTAAHEVAHAVMFRTNGIYGIGGHGPEWLEIFRSLGGTDERYFEGGTHYES